MSDLSEAINALSLFIGVLGLLFANWVSEADVLLSKKMPAHYADRRPYLRDLSSVLFYKIIPLKFFTVIFFSSQLGIFFSIVSSNSIYVPLITEVGRLNISGTIFVLVFLALFYFMSMTIVSFSRLIAAIRRAGRDRTPAQPRIHIFG